MELDDGIQLRRCSREVGRVRLATNGPFIFLRAFSRNPVWSPPAVRASLGQGQSWYVVRDYCSLPCGAFIVTGLASWLSKHSMQSTELSEVLRPIQVPRRVFWR